MSLKLKLNDPQNRNKANALLVHNSICEAYIQLYNSYHSRNSDESPTYFLNEFFKNNAKIKDPQFDYKFWKRVFKFHGKNLICCLEKREIDLDDISYFDQLKKNRFEKSLFYKSDERTFGEIVGQIKFWALYGNKQQAARLFSLAVDVGIIIPLKKNQIGKQEHCNMVLGLHKKEDLFNLKRLFEFPFITGVLKLTPRSVYKNGIELLDYVQDQKEFYKIKNIIIKALSNQVFKDYNQDFIKTHT